MVSNLPGEKMSTFTFRKPDCVCPEHDLSSPEEETASSFHTPKHNAGTNCSSLYSVLTSQDSIDVFHDAFSTLHLPQRMSLPPSSFSHSPSRHPHHRRRHFSSGPKLGDDKVGLVYEGHGWDEPDESTCMLPKGPLERILHVSPSRVQSQVSRSCSGSPFHLPHLSFSTHSLKHKPADKADGWTSQQRQAAKQETTSSALHELHGDVEIIREFDEADMKEAQTKSLSLEMEKTPDPISTKSTVTPLSDSPANPPLAEFPHKTMNGGADPDKWRRNYVPCAEIDSLFRPRLSMKTQPGKPVKNEKDGFSVKTIRRRQKTWPAIKDEFSLSNFKFDHKTPHLFVTSQWQKPTQMCCMYLAYRLFWGVYFVMWGVWSWVGFGGYDSPAALKSYYLLYLTSWAMWLLAADTMFQAVNVAVHLKKISIEGDAKYSKMKTSFKISWILSTITASVHIFIPIMFWSAVFPTDSHSMDPISVNTYIIPGIYVISDGFISATPRRVFHAYLPMGLLTVYGMFTDIYYLAGGLSHKGKIALYPFLDWSEPSKTLLTGSAMVLLLVPAIHIFVICALYGIRVNLWRNLDEDSRYHQPERETIEANASMEQKV